MRNGGGPGFDDAFDGLAVLAHRVAYRILASSEMPTLPSLGPC